MEKGAREHHGSLYEFNKELLLGEVGAIIGAPTVAWIVSHLTSSTHFISLSAVGGALIGAALGWLTMRIWHMRRREQLSMWNLAGDLAYFTPVAFLLTMLIYYPILYLLSSNFLNQKLPVVSSVFFSQLIAFSCLVLAMNIYRYLLGRFHGKRL